MTFPVLAASNPSGYNISRSVRLRSSASAYFTRTPAVAGNRKLFTISTWVKRGALGSAQDIITATSGAGGTVAWLRFNASNQLDYVEYNGAGFNANAQTTAVFRDPGAWYYITVAFDSAQATAANRLKVYVNNVQYTLSGTYPTLNLDSYFSGTGAHYIGREARSAIEFFDGYLAEFNFIDGQALTPASFGSANATTGVWQPARYTGTYGTTGFYLPFNIGTASTYSGVFNGSAQYLSAPTNAVFAQQSGTNFTVEAWVLSSSATLQQLCVYANSTITTGNDVGLGIYFTPGSTLGCFMYNGTSSNSATSTINVPSGQWCHLAVVNNGGTVTLYINGVACGTFTALTTNSGGAFQFYIGNYGGARYINGQVSNFRLVKGTAVYTSNFTPPTAPLTAITNTAFLTLQNATFVDNSTNAFTITNTGSVTTTTATPFSTNIGGDASGNNNTWTPNNINYSTSGVTYDSMVDVPTPYADGSTNRGNYAVINPLNKSGSTAISNGNLYASATTNAVNAAVSSIACPTSIQSYWEVTISSVGDAYRLETGMATSAWTFAATLSSSTPTLAVQQNAGNTTLFVYVNTTSVFSVANVLAVNDVYMFAYDDATNKVWVGKNGTWFNSGVPASGTGNVGTLTSGNAYFPCAQLNTAAGTNAVYFNFGQRPFSYTPPSGFKALNTYNLPASTITNGGKYMAATTYTGTSANQSIVNAGGFKPDLVWLKTRSVVSDHGLFDSTRGVNTFLSSNTTGADAAVANTLTAFNSNGFSLGTDATNAFNGSGRTMVGWQWQAGQGSTSSNTSGSITSTVSVNATAGFSIVTYTGTGANATVGHGLGVAPKMIINKDRINGTVGWDVYHSSMNASPATGRLQLNTTAAFTTDSTIWNNTAPTSSVFSIGTGSSANINGNSHVTYCWSEIAGFSKFGSYTGNGSADGPFVYCGFRPRWVMLKKSSAAGDNWFILDTARNTYNVTDLELCPNGSNAELTLNYSDMDITANGFKIRSADTQSNASGATFIFAAFAENPFANALAR